MRRGMRGRGSASWTGWHAGLTWAPTVKLDGRESISMAAKAGLQFVDTAVLAFATVKVLNPFVSATFADNR
jgi:hypothetical protein